MLPQKTSSAVSESFASHFNSTLCAALEPGPLARLAARVRPATLNEALVTGADPACSRQLAARAARLTSRPSRASLADGVEHLLRAAHGPATRRRVVPRREAVLANAAELHELAAVLREAAPVYARGVAIVEQLLIDGMGPAYVGDADALGRRLHEARTAMGGRDRLENNHDDAS